MRKELRIHVVLKRLLKESGLTISSLARRSGVPHSTLSTWLLPRAKPRDPVHVASVASVLGTTMHFLLFDEPESELTLDSVKTKSVLDGLYRLKLERVVGR